MISSHIPVSSKSKKVIDNNLEVYLLKVFYKNSPTEERTVSSNDLFNLYPNPANDRLYFNFAEVSTKIEICSLDGKVLIISENTGNAGDINVSYLQSGIYIVKAYFNSSVKPLKIIKL